ncbi:MAG: YigZ family protein [Gammaproteobacteria bacterium]|nr:YigZ family protein [Gammaproteobacteria bacterium]MDH5628745.1 YigZ family protein [Gammaproteobacteria bacterium]
MTGYQVPSKQVEFSEKIKNSQFVTRIANVDSVEAARRFLKLLNNQFPDATHHCWAYIVGNPESTTLVGCSDDGEPSGTAGKPMLNVLQHSGLGDIMAVCTRYYGGTKLGTGGLSRAYGGGVKQALELVKIKSKIDYIHVQFTVDYENIKSCENLLSNFECKDIVVDYEEQVTFKLAVDETSSSQLKSQLYDLLKGKLEWNIIK